MPDPDFDAKFKLFPPDLQAKLWVLGLDANTSRVNIAYKPGGFVTSLTYNYGGSVQASLGIRRFTTTVGVNPSNGALNLGVVYRGFNFAASGDVAGKSAGVGLGFGDSLLPFPAELTSTFNSAAGGLQSIAGDISSAPNNPLAWYRLHSNDVSTISRAISTGQQIGKFGGDSNNFGVGLRLNYTPQTGLTIYTGAQLRF
jgi:hypothetical protein